MRLRIEAIIESGCMRASKRIKSIVSVSVIYRWQPVRVFCSVSSVWSPPCQCRTRRTVSPSELAMISFKTVRRTRFLNSGGSWDAPTSAAHHGLMPRAPISWHCLAERTVDAVTLRALLQSAILALGLHSSDAQAPRQPGGLRGRPHRTGAALVSPRTALAGVPAPCDGAVHRGPLAGSRSPAAMLEVRGA